MFKKFAILFVFGLAACAEPAPSYDYTAEIEAANTAFEEAYNRGDAAAIASYYTEDAVLMPPGAPTVKGAKNLAPFWQAVMDSGLAKVDLVDEEIIGHGDTAINRGRIIAFDADGNQIATGKFMVYWKNVDGGWKLHFDIYNLDG